MWISLFWRFVYSSMKRPTVIYMHPLFTCFTWKRRQTKSQKIVFLLILNIETETVNNVQEKFPDLEKFFGTIFPWNAWRCRHYLVCRNSILLLAQVYFKENLGVLCYNESAFPPHCSYFVRYIQAAKINSRNPY